jgi:hypothetical protein
MLFSNALETQPEAGKHQRVGCITAIQNKLRHKTKKTTLQFIPDTTANPRDHPIWRDRCCSCAREAHDALAHSKGFERSKGFQRRKGFEHGEGL